MMLREWNFRSEDRGYALLLGRDLLGDLILVRRWWGLYTKLGGQKTAVIGSEAEAMVRVDAEIRLRQRRGYSLLTH